MLRRAYRLVSLLTLLALLMGAAAPITRAQNPGPTPAATPAPAEPDRHEDLHRRAPGTAPAPGISVPPVPVPHQAAPVVDPHLPSLALDLTLTPDPVAVGDVVTLTLTVTNQAPDPALNLVVTLPLPAGTVALPAAPAGWTWSRARLDAHSRTTLLATMQVTGPPPGGALLLRPTATAQGLAQPVTLVGGAVVVPASAVPVVTQFIPGAAAVLRSSDGQTEVHLPAGAFGRPLTLQHRAPLAGGALAPHPSAGLRHGFAPFTLTATDPAGQAVHQFDQPLTFRVGYTPEQLQALGIAELSLTLFWFDDAQHTWQALPTTVDPLTHSASAVANHFTEFELADGSSPSAAFIPTLQSF